MRAVIITDEEAKSLLGRLKLKALQEDNFFKSSKCTPEAIQEAHRIFHYVVCRWLTSVGADVVEH